MIPGFVAILIQTPFFIDLVQFNRVGSIKQSMYAENLCQVRVPYLPESEQRRYAEARDKTLIEIEKAKMRFAATRQDILGVKPVPADLRRSPPCQPSRYD